MSIDCNRIKKVQEKSALKPKFCGNYCILRLKRTNLEPAQTLVILNLQSNVIVPTKTIILNDL
ncbi:hypothetical protein ACLK29_09965 [Leptospira kirschneri]|uniref:Uncharacterized protein n=1 Tax=Leptospira kirschneri str. 200802841 TaxID=1193047 RepID=A0A828XT90_9LEPT|nr:hypothetical protein LEP1GSC131_1071 [Leptospira kirschneri str. 200802841]